MSSVKWPTQHYDLVLVAWDDAAGMRHGWAGKSEVIEPQMALSVGFLIQETADHIRIAQDTDSEGAHNGRTQIPRGMVKKLKILRKAYSPKKEKHGQASQATVEKR